MLITTIPYFIGFARQGDSWRYTGFVFGIEDGNSYIAKMSIGSSGGWLFRTPYTSYPQQGFLAFFPYILIGKLAASPELHDQLVVLFHCFRWVAGILSILATYDFIALFVREEWARRLGTAIASIGGGLGWLSIIGFGPLWQERLPLEFYSPETFGFLSIYGLPHLAMARALLLWGLTNYLSPHKGSGGFWMVFRQGLLWTLLGFMQPLTIVVGWCVILAHIAGMVGVRVWHKVKEEEHEWSTPGFYAGKSGWIFVFSSPFVLYNVTAFQVVPFLKKWISQNLILSPPVTDYLLAYGLVVPFAIIFMVRLAREGVPDEYWLVLCWATMLPLLAYAPYNLQRRLPEGIWVAFTVLALKGVEYQGAEGRKLRPILYISFLSPLTLLIGGILAVWTPSVPLYRTVEEIESFKFLKEHAMPGNIVLAGYSTSNSLPAWAPLNTLVGHGPESIHLKEMMPKIEEFFMPGSSDEARLILLNEFNVDYIIRGPEEETGENWGLEDDGQHIEMIFRNDLYEVYEVLK